MAYQEKRIKSYSIGGTIVSLRSSLSCRSLEAGRILGMNPCVSPLAVCPGLLSVLGTRLLDGFYKRHDR